MANYLKLSFSLILLLGAINSCKSQTSNKIITPPKECIELNNKGMKYLMNYPDEKELDTAINLLNEAVKCDPTYLIAYSNLTIAYDRKKSYNDEMSVFNKVLVFTNNAPLYLLRKGVLFERMGKIDSANKTYQLAKIEYEKRIDDNPKAGLIEGLALTEALTGGKDAAIKELNQQIKEHPELSSKLSDQYAFYKDFDRHAFVYGLTIEKSSNATIAK